MWDLPCLGLAVKPEGGEPPGEREDAEAEDAGHHRLGDTGGQL